MDEISACDGRDLCAEEHVRWLNRWMVTKVVTIDAETDHHRSICRSDLRLFQRSEDLHSSLIHVRQVESKSYHPAILQLTTIIGYVTRHLEAGTNTFNMLVAADRGPASVLKSR